MVAILIVKAAEIIIVKVIARKGGAITLFNSGINYSDCVVIVVD